MYTNLLFHIHLCYRYAGRKAIGTVPIYKAYAIKQACAYRPNEKYEKTRIFHYWRKLIALVYVTLL